MEVYIFKAFCKRMIQKKTKNKAFYREFNLIEHIWFILQGRRGVGKENGKQMSPISIFYINEWIAITYIVIKRWAEHKF